MPVQACVRLVSPYSADLQKRASDMTAEVAGWDWMMRGTSGQIPVKDVQTTLAKWNGEVDAMAGLAASIDPKIISCDRIAGKMMGDVATLLPKDLKDELPTPEPQATKPDRAAQGCEASLFAMMADDIAELKGYMVSECGLTALKEGGAVSSPSMTSQCRALFGGDAPGQSGPAVNNLLRDLNAVVYIEGRKKPTAAK
jgi:hypothetical protein